MSLSFDFYDAPREVPVATQAALVARNAWFSGGAFVFLFGMVFLLVFSTQIDFRSVFFTEPFATTPGQLTSVKETRASQNERRIYEYGYEYTVDDQLLKGVSYQSKSPDLMVGAAVTVEYQQNQPTFSRAQGMQLKPFSLGVFPLLLIFPLIGAALLLHATRQGLRHIHLVKNGVLVSGVVTKKIPTESSINNQVVYEVFFGFKTLEGVEVAATINTHQIAALGDDAKVLLVYDSSQPQNAVLLDAMDKSAKKLFGQ
jgi:hypothetical protein